MSYIHSGQVATITEGDGAGWAAIETTQGIWKGVEAYNTSNGGRTIEFTINQVER